MDDRLRFAVEMYDVALSRTLERTLAHLEEGETEWRPLPESNNVALIVPAPRHRGAVASRLP